MQLIRGLHNLRPDHRPSVVTIGNFDGLHRGHRSILRRLQARTDGTRSTLITFEPTPLEHFDPAAAPPRLNRLSETIAMLEEEALVDQLLCLRFDAALAAMTPERFVRDVLVEGLHCRHLIVGEDFRYGARRAGDIESLRQAGDAAGFSVEVAGTVVEDGDRVSSTGVRSLLASGDVGGAAQLLGRRYRVTGKVRRGQQAGRSIGFPTANLHLARKAALRTGVYAVRVCVGGSTNLPAVANFGTRPTVSGQGHLLEVHCLDETGDLYGQRLWVEFVQFIRPERRFDGLSALKQQIQHDVVEARRYLEH
ncbi:bifunctional riboflavin kinase/FAD synthetase [uncultured Abyssibacter sp.]|uniref:bifunctional riboflavin kinase/FAD synthetase n=1 Tax=uncultured Abyssibacter sp. TaxID=2320202 RepID=UPI0032B14D9D